MYELPENRKKDAGILRMPDDAVDTIGDQATTGEIDPYPPSDDQDQTGENERKTDRHLHLVPVVPVTEQRRPQMAAAVDHRNLDLKNAGQDVDRERKAIHLAIQRDDDRLHQARPSPLAPTRRCEQMVQDP